MTETATICDDVNNFSKQESDDDVGAKAAPAVRKPQRTAKKSRSKKKQWHASRAAKRTLVVQGQETSEQPGPIDAVACASEVLTTVGSIDCAGSEDTSGLSRSPAVIHEQAAPASEVDSTIASDFEVAVVTWKCCCNSNPVV